MIESLALKYRRIRERHCKENRMSEIIEILRKDNRCYLWDKLKYNWNIVDWENFFELKNKK
jgi:hypothetical protein